MSDCQCTDCVADRLYRGLRQRYSSEQLSMIGIHLIARALLANGFDRSQVAILANEYPLYIRHRYGALCDAFAKRVEPTTEALQ